MGYYWRLRRAGWEGHDASGNRESSRVAMNDGESASTPELVRLKLRLLGRNPTRALAISLALVVLAAAMMGYAFSSLVGKGHPWDQLAPYSFDWDVFREAIFETLAGRNPYRPTRDTMLFYNPPWALIPLLPLAFLPRTAAVLLLAIASILTVTAVSRKLGHGLAGTVLIASSALHVEAMGHGQIEFLPWLGLFFPLPVALLFLTIKPQATMGVILLLLWREVKRKENGWLSAAKAAAPTVILGALTLIFWGLPPRPQHLSSSWFWIAKTIVLGVPALVLGIKRDDLAVAAAAGPLIGPYAIFHSYLSVLFPFKRLWLLIPLVGMSYLVWLFVLN